MEEDRTTNLEQRTTSRAWLMVWLVALTSPCVTPRLCGYVFSHGVLDEHSLVPMQMMFAVAVAVAVGAILCSSSRWRMKLVLILVSVGIQCITGYLGYVLEILRSDSFPFGSRGT